MQIVALGWGSLIWDRRNLEIVEPWSKDGPRLPIEFARISNGDRLTLVIHPGVAEQTTYWARSKIANLAGALENLKEREGSRCKLASIHYVTSGSDKRGDAASVATIGQWLGTQQGIDAAIWTGLTSNWLEKCGNAFNSLEALNYIAQLQDKTKAEDYVRKAPPQIQTDVRGLLKSKYNWQDIPPPQTALP